MSSAWALTSEPLTQDHSAAFGNQMEEPVHKARKTQQEGGKDMEEQRVILVTEPHTDINAGFVVVLGSGHDPPLDIEQIEDQVAKAAGTAQEKIWLDLAIEAFVSYIERLHSSTCVITAAPPLSSSKSRARYFRVG